MSHPRVIVLASFAVLAVVGLTFCGSTDDAVGQTGPGVGGTSQAGSSSGPGGSASGGAPSTAGSAGSTTAAGAAGAQCANAQPVLIAGTDVGIDQCDGDFTRRRAAGTCPNQIPRADVCQSPVEQDGACKTDVDCKDQPNGRCLLAPSGDFSTCGCDYTGCSTDADCAADELCRCGDGLGSCIKTACRTAADCAGGAQCLSVTTQTCFGETTTYECSDAAPACSTTTTCPGDAKCQQVGWTSVCAGGFACPG